MRHYDSKKSKRKSNQETLGEVIDRMLNAYRLKGGLLELSINNHWKEIVGDAVAAKTVGLKLRGDTLVVSMNSAAMRHELHYQRQDIAANVNAFLQDEVVKQVELRDA